MNALVWCWSDGLPAVLTSPSLDDALRLAASLVASGCQVSHVEVLDRGRVERLLAEGELDKALEPFLAKFEQQAAVDDQGCRQRAAVQVRRPGGWPWFTDRMWSGPDAAAEAEKRLAELGLPPERVRVNVWTDD